MIPSVSFRLPVSQTKLSFDLTWLVFFPACIWVTATSYVAVIGAFLSSTGIWETALLCSLGTGISLTFHVLAHFYAARLARQPLPPVIPVLLFGDAGQAWLPATEDWKELLLLSAGPAINLVLGGLAFMVWNAQLNPIVNVISPFIAGFNAWMIIINVIPAFPFDGGRLVHVLLKGLFGKSGWVYSGFVVAGGLVGWAVFLFSQQSRYSTQTAGVTLSFAVLILFGLLVQPTRIPHELDRKPGMRLHLPGLLAGGLVISLMAGTGSTLLMTNNGLDAPGAALSVEPMVAVPTQYRQNPKGTFYLTAVISQAPVPAAGWYLSKMTPVVKLLPPEKITPNPTSPQESARQGFQMLDQSEVVAAAVGVRLAGFPTEIIGKGAKVDSILPESLANGLLQPGDVITAIDGQPVSSATNLINLVKTHDPKTPAYLKIIRDGVTKDTQVNLLPPANPGDPPRIGIAIEDAGFDYHLPFPVTITPQKIVGGPSAGLMFTLTVYNLLSPVDLTGGRRIAGTGTISPDGSVGPIGGVEQKVAAAEMIGAEYFFAPAENYADAIKSAHNIKVIKVETVDQAVAFLRSLPPR